MPIFNHNFYSVFLLKMYGQPYESVILEFASPIKVLSPVYSNELCNLRFFCQLLTFVTHCVSTSKQHDIASTLATASYFGDIQLGPIIADRVRYFRFLGSFYHDMSFTAQVMSDQFETSLHKLHSYLKLRLMCPLKFLFLFCRIL